MFWVIRILNRRESTKTIVKWWRSFLFAPLLCTTSASSVQSTFLKPYFARESSLCTLPASYLSEQAESKPRFYEKTVKYMKICNKNYPYHFYNASERLWSAKCMMSQFNSDAKPFTPLWKWGHVVLGFCTCTIYLVKRSSFLVKLFSFHQQKTMLGLRLWRSGSDLFPLLSLISTPSSRSEQTDDCTLQQVIQSPPGKPYI